MDEVKIFVEYVVIPVGLITIIAMVVNVIMAPMYLERLSVQEADRVKRDLSKTVSFAADLQKQLRMRLPSFKLGIDVVAIGESGDKKFVSFTVIANLSNTGSPSAADGWELRVVKPDGSAVVPQIQAVQGNFKLLDGAKNLLYIPGEESSEEKPNVFHEQQMLYERALKPIATGEKVRGVLLFLAEGVGRSQDFRTCRLTLKCHDIYGTSYSRDFDFQGPKGRYTYLPGMGRFE